MIDLIQLRKDLQIIDAAGIPCRDMNPHVHGFDIFELSWAVREDAEVDRLAPSCDDAVMLSVLRKFTDVEKYQLRTRLARHLHGELQKRVLPAHV